MFGKPRWAMREYYDRKLHALTLRLFGDQSWVTHFIRAAYLEGTFAEIDHYRSRGGVPPPGYLVPPGAGL